MTVGLRLAVRSVVLERKRALVEAHALVPDGGRRVGHDGHEASGQGKSRELKSVHGV